MLSTYDSYRFYAQDLAKSVSRVAAQPAVQRDTAYYQANIGKVKTVDDFLKNPRLYTYALTTYGLEDAIPNRGFIRKVLTSDTTDPKSFVNKLNDTRYRALAAAFAFTTTGKVVTTAVTQDATQEDETLGLYSRRTLVLGPQPNATAATKAQQDDIDYYKAHIGRVSSLSDLTGDHRLYRIALQAYGLDPATRTLPDDVAAQTRLMFWQIERVLRAAGASFEDVVRMTFYVKAPEARAHVNEHWLAAFPEPESRPARHTLAYDGLPANMLVQCDAMAMVGDDG